MSVFRINRRAGATGEAGMQLCQAKTEKTQDSLALLGGRVPRPAGDQYGLQAAVRVNSNHHEVRATAFYPQCAAAGSLLAVAGQVHSLPLLQNGNKTAMEKTLQVSLFQLHFVPEPLTLFLAP